MANPQLVDYIHKSREAGVTEQQIIQNLISSGWTKLDIEDAINDKGIQGNTADRNSSIASSVPVIEEKKFVDAWSWGAFFLYVIYFIGSKDYKRAFLYLLGGAIPILNIYLWIKSAIHGRKLVWETGKWENFDSYKKRQHILDKIGLISFFIITFIFIATIVFAFVNSSKTSNNVENSIPTMGLNAQRNELSITEQKENQDINISAEKEIVSNPEQITNDPDIDQANKAINEIKEAFLTGNWSSAKKYSTEATGYFYDLLDPEDKAISFTINDVSKNGTEIIANVTMVNSDNETENWNMAFLNINGDWKFDILATNEKLNQKIEPPTVTDTDTNKDSLPNLVITGVTIFPNRPIVNDKNVRIEAAIKNNGTKPVVAEFTIEADLIEFKEQLPTIGVILSEIMPGETFTWNFIPYSGNDFLKINDIAGKKTLRITINNERSITESNYDDNIFTQTIEMYDR